MNPLLICQLLLLVALANGAPILAKKLLGDAFSRPLDGGRKLGDDQPVFGSAKTVRGVSASICATSLGAPLIGLPISAGTTVAVGAMIGDLVSSFIKRRLRLPVSSPAPLLDQAPESLFALIGASLFLNISATEMIVVAISFFVGQMALSRLLFAWGVRDRPS